MTAKRAPNSAAASKNITKRIQELGDWRGETVAWVRQLIHHADFTCVDGLLGLEQCVHALSRHDDLAVEMKNEW